MRQVKKMTPAPAVLFHAVVALGMVLSGSIEGLIDFFRWEYCAYISVLKMNVFQFHSVDILWSIHARSHCAEIQGA